MPNSYRWLPGFALLSFVWGASFTLIKIAVEAGVGPVWVALWRCFFGAVALVAICLARGIALPRKPSTWGHAVVVATLLNAVPFSLVAFGETRVSSVLAGMWNATTPLATLLFAMAMIPEERPTARRLLGLLTGFCGVLVLLEIWRGLDGGTLLGSLACLAATTCYGAGFAYTRRFFSGNGESAAALSAAQIVSATGLLAVAAPLAGGAPTWPGGQAALALVVLGMGATGVAYVINLGIIRTAGPTVASTVTYVTPLWSTLLGALLLTEPLGWNMIAGGVLVLAGVVLTRQGRPKPVVNRTRGTWMTTERATGRRPRDCGGRAPTCSR